MGWENYTNLSKRPPPVAFRPGGKRAGMRGRKNRALADAWRENVFHLKKSGIIQRNYRRIFVTGNPSPGANGAAWQLLELFFGSSPSANLAGVEEVPRSLEA